MAISEQARHQMYTRLESVLGADEAATLMEHLPPVGWADVATKRDLDVLGESLRAEIRSEIGAFRGEIGAFRGEVGREIGALRGEVGREIGALRGEMHVQARSLFFQMLGLQVSAVVAISTVVRFL